MQGSVPTSYKYSNFPPHRTDGGDCVGHGLLHVAPQESIQAQALPDSIAALIDCMLCAQEQRYAVLEPVSSSSARGAGCSAHLDYSAAWILVLARA